MVGAELVLIDETTSEDSEVRGNRVWDSRTPARKAGAGAGAGAREERYVSSSVGC